MKKLFTSALLVLSALTMQAKDYSGNLHISVPDMNAEVDQATSVTVNNQGDGKYELIIKDFNFDGMEVGTIDVKDVNSQEKNGYITLSYNGTTTILPNSQGGGDLQYSPVNLNVNAKMTDNELYTHIVINALGMDIAVSLTPNGKVMQIPNSDFEKFHTAEFSSWGTSYTTKEADHWHSFTSAHTTSAFLNSARRQEQSFESTDIREGANGTKCLLIKSALPISTQPANGTVTTGRLQAGSSKPKDPANHAFLNLDNKDKDDNGDPFYIEFNSTPDEIQFWARFKQGQSNLSSKFGSVRAVITDGTYYQDPEDKSYTNIVSVASNKTIEGTDKWQLVTANFDYETYKDNNVSPKAILVTISTNAEPGVGSKDKNNPDYIYIDDLSLVYKAGLKSLTFKGQELFEENKKEYEVSSTGTFNISDINVASDGKGADIDVSVENVDGGSKATITITSEDWRTQNTYVLNIKGATTGIDALKNMNYKNGVQAIYNLAGQQVGSMTPGQVYIVKTTDGQTKKVIKK